MLQRKHLLRHPYHQLEYVSSICKKSQSHEGHNGKFESSLTITTLILNFCGLYFFKFLIVEEICFPQENKP